MVKAKTPPPSSPFWMSVSASLLVLLLVETARPKTIIVEAP